MVYLRIISGSFHDNLRIILGVRILCTSNNFLTNPSNIPAKFLVIPRVYPRHTSVYLRHIAGKLQAFRHIFLQSSCLYRLSSRLLVGGRLATTKWPLFPSLFSFSLRFSPVRLLRFSQRDCSNQKSFRKS